MDLKDGVLPASRTILTMTSTVRRILFGTFPFIPSLELPGIQQALKYFKQHKACAFCDLLEAELRNKNNIIHKNKIFAAMIPFCSPHPLEMWLIPLKHRND